MIKLTARTRKGKNVISNHGNMWEEIRRQETVKFSSQPGGWVLITSGDDLRWVHLTDDKDFILEED